MNYSGSTKRNTIERKEISIRPQNEEIIIDTMAYENEIEMKMIIELFEKTKEENAEMFHKVMLNIKKIIDIFSLQKCTRDELKLLDDLFTEVESINKDFLFWCVNKGIKMAVIENKNIDLAHFILIKKNYKLTNKLIHKNILIEYFLSLSNIDFIVCDDEIMNNYMTILEILIFYASADINEKQDGIENTPLHISVLHKQYQFIVALVKNKNCLINSKNKNGETPLDFAISKFGSGQDEAVYEEIIKLLVMHGAILNEDNI